MNIKQLKSMIALMADDAPVCLCTHVREAETVVITLAEIAPLVAADGFNDGKAFLAVMTSSEMQLPRELMN